MPDVENVIKGLMVCFTRISCKGKGCPYESEYERSRLCQAHLRDDALALLKAQEPHIMSKEDFENNPNADEKGYIPVWVEYNRNDDWGEWWKDQPDEWAVLQTATVTDGESRRYWSGKPTKEQMEAVKWE